MNDYQLIQSYLKGNQTHFEELYYRYREQLYRYLFSLFPNGNNAEADDLYQKVWMRIIDNLERFRQDGNFRAWGCRIAKNMYIDHWRRRGHIYCDPDEVVIENRETPFTLMHDQELELAMSSAIDELSDEQREVVNMRRRDIPFRDIAEHQGVSINTALARMSYAVKRIKGILKNKNVE